MQCIRAKVVVVRLVGVCAWSLQIALRAVRGTGFSSDIAVDNVRLTLGRC